MLIYVVSLFALVDARWSVVDAISCALRFVLCLHFLHLLVDVYVRCPLLVFGCLPLALGYTFACLVLDSSVLALIGCACDA